MVQNNSSQNNNQSSWNDNSPSIRNIPNDSVEMENIKFGTDFWGTPSYTYESNGKLYSHDSLGTHPVNTPYQDFKLTVNVANYAKDPRVKTYGVLGTAIINIKENGWKKGTAMTFGGLATGKLFKGNITSNIADNVGSNVIGKVFDNIPNNDSSYTIMRGGLVIPNGMPTESIKGSVEKNVLNKDLSPSGTLLKGYVSKDANATSQAAKLSGESFYDPRTEQVNYDVTQRIYNKNGTVSSPTKLEGQVANNNLAAASDPASMNKLYKTPNAAAIENTLYKVKTIGSNYLKGYLVGRSMELVLGKKTAAKVNKYVGYYNTASFVASKVAETAWTAAQKAVVNVAKQAWGSVVNSAFGQAIKGAWSTAATAITNSAFGQAVSGVISNIAATAFGHALGVAAGFISAALPWVGVAMIIGSLFRLW